MYVLKIKANNNIFRLFNVKLLTILINLAVWKFPYAELSKYAWIFNYIWTL